MSTDRSFSELLQLHSEMDAVFLEHQYALLRFDVDLASKRLGTYRQSLLQHMSDEETILLPLYERCVPAEKGGGVKLFLDEHSKMREFVDLFSTTTERLRTEPEPEPLLLQLLEREAFYKRLCSHHDIREERFLYPSLDRAIPETQRAAILRRILVPQGACGMHGTRVE